MLSVKSARNQMIADRSKPRAPKPRMEAPESVSRVMLRDVPTIEQPIGGDGILDDLKEGARKVSKKLAETGRQVGENVAATYRTEIKEPVKLIGQTHEEGKSWKEAEAKLLKRIFEASKEIVSLRIILRNRGIPEPKQGAGPLRYAAEKYNEAQAQKYGNRFAELNAELRKKMDYIRLLHEVLDNENEPRLIDPRVAKRERKKELEEGMIREENYEPAHAPPVSSRRPVPGMIQAEMNTPPTRALGFSRDEIEEPPAAYERRVNAIKPVTRPLLPGFSSHSLIPPGTRKVVKE